MNKKVFISYSWGNKEHQEWIVNLATRLMNDSVEVVLDRWSLKEGHDIFSFMEEMVKSEEIYRVLIISNREYAVKANEREGGVGTETQIITPNIYANEKQDKFIPIVLERNEKGKPFLPVYLLSRKYLDFSKIENYEDSYEELLRNILDAPSLPKPKLGKNPPAYITEAAVNLSETNNKLKTIENQLKKNNTIPINELNTFLDLFLDNLWNFDQINKSVDLKTYGELLINTLKSYKPLREDFIKFIDVVSSKQIEDLDDILIGFFENAPVYESPREPNSSWTSSRFEIFKIIFHELFIYTIAICLKNRDYNLISDLFYRKYFIKDKFSNNAEPVSFTSIYHYHDYLEDYSFKYFNKITGFGDLLVTNLSDTIKKDDLILADILCYFISCIDYKNHYKTWFPHLFLYSDREGIIFFNKMTSEKQFERSKILFNVQTKEELAQLLNQSKNDQRDRKYYRLGNPIPYIYELINPDTIGIYR